MTVPLAQDARGNALLRLVAATEDELRQASAAVSCPLALVVIAAWAMSATKGTHVNAS